MYFLQINLTDNFICIITTDYKGLKFMGKVHIMSILGAE
jgi:hypothetical protein